MASAIENTLKYFLYFSEKIRHDNSNEISSLIFSENKINFRMSFVIIS